jgi:hypothetical protein
MANNMLVMAEAEDRERGTQLKCKREIEPEKPLKLGERMVTLLSPLFAIVAPSDGCFAARPLIPAFPSLCFCRAIPASLSTLTSQAMERERGLETSIPKSNIGHKLLAAMGYKEVLLPPYLSSALSCVSHHLLSLLLCALLLFCLLLALYCVLLSPCLSSPLILQGEGVGKRKEGRVVPIIGDVKAGRGGLGRDAHVLDQQRVVMERTLAQANAHVKHFRSNKRGNVLLRLLVSDRGRAVRVCESLDRREGIIDNELWASEIVEEGGKITDPVLNREERREAMMAEVAARPTAEDINRELVPLLTYLRERHRYCIFCSIEFESKEDLRGNCPGPLRSEHDDIDDD